MLPLLLRLLLLTLLLLRLLLFGVLRSVVCHLHLDLLRSGFLALR